MPNKSVRAPLPDLDDLLQRTRDGDKHAREQLFKQLRAELKQRAQIKVREQRPGGLDASDLADEALERFLKHSEDFVGDTGGELRGYLFSILENYIFEMHRYANREKRSERKTVPLDKLGSGPQVKPSLNTLMIDKQDRQWLWGKLVGLSEPQRQALFYRHEGFSVARIAKELERTEKGVTSLLARAVCAVRTDLHDLSDNPAHQDAPLQGAFLRYLHLLEGDRRTDREAYLMQHEGQPGMRGLRALLEGVDWLDEQLHAEEQLPA